MGKMTDTLKRELKEVGSATLYFLMTFSLILLLKKLFLAEYEISIYPLSQVIVGSLVVAKVVVILDHTSLGKGFENNAPYLKILYRSGVYTLAVAVVGVIERMFHLRHEADSVGEAFRMVYAGGNFHHFIATILCIGLAFVGYNLLAVVNEHLGDGGLGRLLFGKAPVSR